MTILLKGIKRFKAYKLDNMCVCNYTTEKYKRKMCYHQKNNLDVKTFERPKIIKEL